MNPFNYQSTDESPHQIRSPTHHQHSIHRDLILNYDSSVLQRANLENNMMPTLDDDSNNNVNLDNDDKRIIRRDLERKRRHEMGMLCATLRSQLPLEFIKGKRSIPDHMSEAVNYIKHLQKNIGELSVKRDELRKKSNSSALIPVEGSSSQHCMANPCVVVDHCSGGVKIALTSSGLDEGKLHLSRVMEVLVEEGLNVVSCVSTKVEQNLLHSIQSEVMDPTSFNADELQRMLNRALLGP